MPEPTTTTYTLEGNLTGVRVVEIGNEQGEYCGLTLCGLGADVIKIEPPEGNATRSIGPFVDDVPDRERSLFFWAYNRGKRSVVLDLNTDRGRGELGRVLDSADVLLDSTPKSILAAAGFGAEEIQVQFPRLVMARITPFGDDGSMGQLQGLRPGAPSARRPVDELWLRSEAGRYLRPPSHGAPGLPLLPYRRRTGRPRYHRRTRAPEPFGAWPAADLCHPRSGFEEYRDGPDGLGGGAPTFLPPDGPARRTYRRRPDQYRPY